MEEKIERIKKWAEGGKAGPYTLEINTTNRCNLECRFCWQRATDPDLTEELNDDKLLKIIDQAIEMGVKEVRIPGSGEPLMRKETVLKMMEKIKKDSVHGLLITNGTFLEEDDLESMVELGWDNLTVSVDGPDAGTHDYLRQVEGTFEKVKNKLMDLKRIKERENSDKPNLRFHTVLTNRNYDKIPEIVELAERVGCEDIKLQPMTPFSEIGEQCMFKGGDEELNSYLETATELADEYNIYNNFEEVMKTGITRRTDEMEEIIIEDTAGSEGGFSSALCFEPWYNMVVLPNGKVGQCSMFGGKGGDQLKSKSLKQVWYGDYFQETRERILDKDLFSYCENCCVAVNFENKKIRKHL